MEPNIYSIITGTGRYIPEQKVSNRAFLDNTFLNANGEKYERSNKEIIKKFEEITGIKERRYVSDDLLTSDLATSAAKQALQKAGTNPESLDYIIVAHNFGDIGPDNVRVDMVPSLASRVKQKLDIKNPYCVAYDLPFGCPGWVQGMIQADCFIKTGEAQRVLVIGSETLSRVCDPHDRDSMLYADGAGAAIVESTESSEPVGIIAHTTRTDASPQADYLTMDRSNKPSDDDTLYLKMEGRKLYEYALTHVPGVVKTSLDEAELTISDVDKVLIHQANAKMDEAIIKRLLKCYDYEAEVEKIMPMTIAKLGNSSVATVPTLLNLILCHEVGNHRINAGDCLIFASVGAGMNINSVVYRVPS